MPVFPWEVERLRPFLVTLVDDLIDRMAVRAVPRRSVIVLLCYSAMIHEVMHFCGQVKASANIRGYAVACVSPAFAPA